MKFSWFYAVKNLYIVLWSAASHPGYTLTLLLFDSQKIVFVYATDDARTGGKAKSNISNAIPVHKTRHRKRKKKPSKKSNIVKGSANAFGNHKPFTSVTSQFSTTLLTRFK